MYFKHVIMESSVEFEKECEEERNLEWGIEQEPGKMWLLLTKLRKIEGKMNIGGRVFVFRHAKFEKAESSLYQQRSISSKLWFFPLVICGCESWTVKKAERWGIDTFVVLEKTLESLLDCKRIQPVHPKGNQSWIFIGRTDVEAETPVLWPPDVKNQLIGKDPDTEKDWR